MLCLLCLEEQKENTLYIKLNDIEGKKQKITNIIKQHFPSDANSVITTLREISNNEDQVICSNCWQTVYEFHDFYLRIIKCHENFMQIKEKSISAEESQPLRRRSVVKLRPTVKQLKVKKSKTKQSQNSSILTETPIEIPNEVYEDIKQHEEIYYNFTSVYIEPDECVVEENELISRSNSPITDPILSRCDQETEQEIDVHIESDKCVVKNDLISRSNSPITDPISSKCNQDIELKIETDKNTDEFGIPSGTYGHTPRYCVKGRASKKIDDFINANFKLDCSLCEEPLEDFTKLKIHFRTKHNQEGYAICCGKKLAKRSLLVDHLRVHLNPNYFSCPQCDQVLTNRFTFEHHIKLKHGGPLKFKCDVCGRGFYKAFAFKKHTLTHMPDEEKTLPCPECKRK